MLSLEWLFSVGQQLPKSGIEDSQLWVACSQEPWGAAAELSDVWPLGGSRMRG